MIVGLTGGIGSGKSTVAKVFNEKFKVPVYVSDDAAKRLMVADTTLISEIKSLLGPESYTQQGQLNKTYIGNRIFNNETLRKALNELVHPCVATDFKRWYAQNKAPYVLKETALLFEIGGHKHCDFTISVIAPLSERIKRIAARDGLDQTAIIKKIESQSSDEFKMELSDFLIYNDNISELDLQVCNIHNKLQSNLQF